MQDYVTSLYYSIEFKTVDKDGNEDEYAFSDFEKNSTDAVGTPTIYYKSSNSEPCYLTPRTKLKNSSATMLLEYVYEIEIYDSDNRINLLYSYLYLTNS